MPDRKLTEAEMITYLQMSVALGSTASLAPREAQSLLNIVNRQKAEIEGLIKILNELKMEAETVYKQRDAQKNRADSIAKFARAKAVKEFADRVDKKFAQCQREYRNVLNNDGACAMIIARKVVVDLVKEMTKQTY